MSNCNNYNQAWSYDREPKVQLFEHDNCNGRQITLPMGYHLEGTSTNGQSLTQNTTLPSHSMTSMYIPPHVQMRARNYWDNDTNLWKTTFYPGWYQDASRLNNWSVKEHRGVFVEQGTHNWNDETSGVTVMPNERVEQSWPAYATQCCYGRYGNKSVDACTSPAGNSIYGPNSDPTCSTPVSAFCQASGNTIAIGVQNAFNSPLCAEWYAGNGAGAETAIKRALCNTHGGLQSRECKDWCRANPGQCDSGSQEFCSYDANKGLSYCGCLTSPVTRYNPKCVDSWCISGVDASGIGGYVTASQNSTGQCPSIIDCQTNIDLEAVGRITTGNVTVSNNCGNTATTCSAIEDHLGQMRDGQLGDRLCAGRTNPTTMICTDAGWVIDRTGSNMCPTVTTPVGSPTAGMNMYILIFIVVLVLAVGGFFLYRRNMTAKSSRSKK